MFWCANFKQKIITQFFFEKNQKNWNASPQKGFKINKLSEQNINRKIHKGLFDMGLETVNFFISPIAPLWAVNMQQNKRIK